MKRKMLNELSGFMFTFEIPDGWEEIKTGVVSKHDKILVFLNGAFQQPQYVNSSHLNIGENVSEFDSVIIYTG